MEVPAPLSGTVRDIIVKTGDKVSEGSIILSLAIGQSPVQADLPPASPPASSPITSAVAVGAFDEKSFALAYAGPAVRKLARELGVDLGKVKGSGNHGRILREDVKAFGKAAAGKPQAAASGGGVGGIDLLPWPKVDFAKFGPVERKELDRIKKISAANFHRNWVVIPHVTTHDEADITDLEQFRVAMNKELVKSGVKLSLLPFMVKAAAGRPQSTRR
jgi:pyruvate dehydrogenase E2 component (dihydrolipoamide acetyltransferase)